MSCLRRFVPWLTLGALIGCVPALWMPLPHGGGRVEFGIVDSFCTLHVDNLSLGTPGKLKLNMWFEPAKTGEFMDLYNSVKFTLYSAMADLPQTMTILVDDEPVFTRTVQYGTTSTTVTEHCVEEDPLTGKSYSTICVEEDFEETKKKGIFKLSEDENRALGAAFPDDGKAHLLAFRYKRSSNYVFEFPPDAIAFIRDPPATCRALTAEARRQAGRQ